MRCMWLREGRPDRETEGRWGGGGERRGRGGCQEDERAQPACRTRLLPARPDRPVGS